MQHAIRRRHHHRVDQTADDLLRLGAPALALECLQQPLDLGAIDERQPWMEQRGRRHVGDCGELCLQLGLAPSHPVELGREQRRIDALQDRGLQPLYACGQFAQLGITLVARITALSGQSVSLADILVDKSLDHVRLHHVVTQCRQHLLLKIVDPDGQAIGAGGRTLLGRCVAGGAELAVLRVGRSANPADDLASEQVARPPLRPEGRRAITIGLRPSDRLLSRLHPLPEVVRQDAEVRDAGRLLEFGWVGEGTPCTRLRILPIGLPLMLGLADIEAVVEDAGAARLVAVDRRRAPLPAARTGYAAAVQLDGDVMRRAAAGILFADVDHCLGLLRLDLSMAWYTVAARVGYEVERIAIGEAAGILPVAEALGDGVTSLATGRGQLLGVHRALEADVEPGDLALGDGVEADAEKLQTLKDHRRLRLAARQAVKLVREHDVDLAALDGLEECGHALAQLDDGAGDRLVGIGSDLGPALLHDERPHILVLHRDRHALLLVGRISGVDRYPHPWGSGSSVGGAA
nr:MULTISPECIES: hypothetical protein [unclassified Sphingomonas]